MKELIIKTNLFTMPQVAVIRENDVIMETFSCSLKDIQTVALNVENLDKITLIGNESFLEPFVKKIKEKEFQKYGKNNLIISVQGE